MEKFVYNKESLPIPVIEGGEDWINLYYKAWETAFRNVDYIEKENWKPQLTCMPGVGIVWQWDSCLMAFITNYSNGTLSALNNLDNLYRLQREDGFMAMAYNIDIETEAYPGRINPPLMAWAEWEAYLVSGDSGRFEKILPILERFYNFIEKNRTRNTGLYWFEDSGSAGMDNAPRGGYPADNLSGSDLCYVDLGCQQALTAKCFAKMYTVLGNEEKAEFYKAEQKRICELINKYHWSEKAGYYFDFFGREAKDFKVKYLNSKTAAAFWSFLGGAATGERAEKMIEHLFNPNEFYTKVPFASLSKDDPNYDEKGGYWLGSIWPPTNYAAIKGIAESGREGLAREAAIRFLDAMCEVDKNKAYGGIWECYAPEEYRPATTENGSIVRADFVGWGGIAPITLLIENIIGLSFDASSNTVTFNMFPNKKAGLKNMLFNGGKVSVECTDYVPFIGKSTVKVTAEKPFRLVVKTNYLWKDVVLEVPAGEHEFKI